jgi:uncharacterized alpha-E superfamily protein
MLARVVENVYWLARYLERAENTARLVNVNTNLVLDLPAGYAPGWMLLVDISGGREVFDALDSRAEDANSERRVVRFLIAERQNASSIVSSLHMAHENARTLREVLPSEVSELLNEFFAEFTRDLANGLNKRTRFDFLKQTVLRLQTLAGQLDGTMNRNDAYTFLEVGRNLERADMTSRIVDVRAVAMLPVEGSPLRPFASIQWMSVLRSLSAYHMYRLRMRERVHPSGVVRFLLADEDFPRACVCCLRRAIEVLERLPNGGRLQRRLARMQRAVSRMRVDRLEPVQLHHFIDRLQLAIGRANDELAKTYFLGELTLSRRQGSSVQVQRQA